MALPSQPNQNQIALAVECILKALGLDVNSPEFADTPERVARLFDDCLDGMFIDPPKLTSFPSNGYEGVIQVHHVPFYSWCAHHLVPIFGHFSIGYIPSNRLLGLSKLVRIFRHGCKVPTTQEEITKRAVDLLTSTVKPKGVICYVEAEHMCMTLRGVKSPGSLTSTTSYSGEFETNQELREQFLAIANKQGAY